MRYGVLSDIHSNLEALNAVVERLEAAGVDGWICCGDLVGYGPDPDACLDRVRQLKNLSVICGNHDLAVVGRLDLEWFNQYARAAVVWTRERLSDVNRVFLEGLTARLETPHFTLAHGTPRNPPEEYLLSPLQFRDNAPLVRNWPLFVGHSHMPLLFRFVGEGNEKVDSLFLEEIEESLPRLAGGAMAPVALNPGSVGQPRDQNNRASCGVYDSDKGTFRVHRLAYDIGAVQEKILAAGLPEYLALRLAYGQ
ncbi:MAG: metallophosphoesterase family protein [Elusimicrobia bacterium]|nr:metallophosphoesterase family protein [Elusimicrobiota bacterium]